VSDVDVRAVVAEATGFTHGIRGLRPGAAAIEGEYRRDYMRGFMKGRVESGIDDDIELSCPDWVNGGEQDIVDD